MQILMRENISERTVPGFKVSNGEQVTTMMRDLIVPGPDVFGISPEVPQGCDVDQAVYVSRHGSRYPDPGAYNGWVSLYNQVGFPPLDSYSKPLLMINSSKRPASQQQDLLRFCQNGSLC